MSHKPFVPFESERPKHRPAKFASRVREELTTLIPGDLRDPRLQHVKFLTITSVELSPDLRHANVGFSLMGDDKNAKEIEAALNKAAGFLRNELRDRLDSKTTPHLLFKFSRGFDNVSIVDDLLKQIES